MFPAEQQKGTESFAVGVVDVDSIVHHQLRQTIKTAFFEPLTDV